MRFFLISLWLLLLTNIALAISCYDCDSMHNPHCDEYFDPEGVKQSDCDDVAMPPYLLKHRRRLPATGCLTKIHEGVDGLPLFIRRTCFFGSLENTREACEAEDPYLPYADILRCDVCDEDLCNTSASERSVPPVPLLLALCLLIGALERNEIM